MRERFIDVALKAQKVIKTISHKPSRKHQLVSMHRLLSKLLFYNTGSKKIKAVLTFPESLFAAAAAGLVFPFVLETTPLAPLAATGGFLFEGRSGSGSS